MVSNPHVQQRVKHFDLLLSRELELIERRHEQNLVTLKKLEQTIRHESKQISKCTRKNPITPLRDVSNQETPPIINRNKKRMHTNDQFTDKANASIESFNSRSRQFDEKTSQQPKYRRLCTKAHRLPPIATSSISPRDQRSNKTIHWMASFQPNKDDEDVNDIFSALNAELSKKTAQQTTKVEKHIHAFMETLPMYENAQKGFDNFGPSALYSNHATVAMR